MPKAVIKVQIHAGGRGKAGGVKVISSANEARDFATKLLDKPLVTHQTGPEGRVVRRMYVEQASEVARELYLGIVVDRKAEAISIIASTEGGMEIEEVAAKTPERIITETYRSDYRVERISGAQDRLRARPQGQAGRPVREPARVALQARSSRPTPR